MAKKKRSTCSECAKLADQWYNVGYSHGYRGEFEHTLPEAPTPSAERAMKKGYEKGYASWDEMRRECNRGRRNFGVTYRTER